eukprot:403354866
MVDKKQADLLSLALKEQDHSSINDDDQSLKTIAEEEYMNFNTKQIIKLENFYVPMDLTDCLLTSKRPPHVDEKQFNKLMHQTLQGLANRINHHQQIHFDILDVLNGELKTRPTYRQTIENFRLNIPRIKEARVQERDEQLTAKNSQRKPLKDDSIVKMVSDRYFAKDNKFLAVDGIKSKDPNLCELYVDTHYIDYMLNNLNQESQFLFEEVKRKVEDNTTNINKLLDSHEREYKWIQTQMFRTIKQSNKTNNLLTRTVLNKFIYQRKKLLYGEWKRHILRKQTRDHKMKHMISIFYKFHAQQAMNIIKAKVRKFALVKDHGRIEGAYILIDEMKGQLKRFDRAMERMYREKSDREDFEKLKLSVDANRAKTLFNDMKELFDSSIIQFKESLEIEKQKMREAFQFMIQETDEKIDKKDMRSFHSRIDKLEMQLHQLTLENSKLKEKQSNDRMEFTMNRYYDELQFSKQKIAFLEQDNDDIRQKVDYFIHVIQTSQGLMSKSQRDFDDIRQANQSESFAVVPFSNNNIQSKFLNTRSGENTRFRRRQQSAEDLSETLNIVGANKNSLNHLNSGNFNTLNQDYRPSTSWGGTARLFSSRPKTNQQKARQQMNNTNLSATVRDIQSAKHKRAQSTIDTGMNLHSQNLQSGNNFFITATPLHINDGSTTANTATAKGMPLSNKQFQMKDSQTGTSMKMHMKNASISQRPSYGILNREIPKQVTTINIKPPIVEKEGVSQLGQRSQHDTTPNNQLALYNPDVLNSYLSNPASLNKNEKLNQTQPNITNIELNLPSKTSQVKHYEDNSKDRQVYSLNPSLNKRIKTKKIEDLRKIAVTNIKKSLTLMSNSVTNRQGSGFASVNQTRQHGQGLANRSSSYKGDFHNNDYDQNQQIEGFGDLPKSIGQIRKDQKYRRKLSGRPSHGNQGLLSAERLKNGGIINDNSNLNTNQLMLLQQENLFGLM